MTYKLKEKCEGCYSQTGLRHFKIVTHDYTLCYVCVQELDEIEKERVKK